MKKILLIFICLAVMCIAGMVPPDVHAFDITVTIPDNKADAVKAGFLGALPNNECAVVDVTDGVCAEKKYTDKQWLKESVRRFIRDTVRNGNKNNKAKQDALEAVPDDLDNSIL